MMQADFEWIIVGGGVSGIAVAEILSREGKSVLLIEKNEVLAGETSKDFHEWVHSGALYTLAPDNLLTLRYLLGATDDLLEFYNMFPNMNLNGTTNGIRTLGAGWFNDERIEFKYNIRKFNPVWLSMVSKSISMIEMIAKHDWLRRRAGSEYGDNQIRLRNWLQHMPQIYQTKNKFYSIKSPDITMNSRILINDLYGAAVSRGLATITGEEVIKIKENKGVVSVVTSKSTFTSKNVVICSPDVVAEHYNTPLNIGYAPMAVVDNLSKDVNSFVELDYHIKTCINLIKKGNGIGQLGGITVENEDEVKPYLNYIISEHKKRNPSIRIVDTYVGIKKELKFKGQNRNYLYHINQQSDRVWSIVLGKFTLAFSMAPEFFRRIFNKNPPKNMELGIYKDRSDLISKTAWLEIIHNSENWRSK